MNNEIKFSRQVDHILASANENGLYVISGWTMAIPRDCAIEYAKSYNSSPDKGFYAQDGSVVLSHRDGKITLSTQEASAVIQLFNAAYGH